jgi:DNA (cytosine-5)-methyltransferase 1
VTLAYYNEHDRRKAAWLRVLIERGLIAPGVVDERDILDVVPAELSGYRQCHFFAGVGVWSYALRNAGWPDDRAVWTVSCPCQPFSAAGKGEGFADERHLWPAWFHLASQCKPDVVFGEQVESDDGMRWLDLVWTDMEAVGYAFGPVVLPAAGVGAPHGRHRIYFVADAVRDGHEGVNKGKAAPGPTDRGGVGAFGLGDPGGRRPGPLNGFWRLADWLRCRDGRWRPVRPGTFPLAHGSAARVVRLCGYGDAIVAPAAEAVIRAYLAETAPSPHP